MKSKHLRGKPISPEPVSGLTGIEDLVLNHFTAYNAARLRECCTLFERKIAQEDVMVGLSVSGALTPAGLGASCLVPLIRNGLVDYIVSTGANLYHDLHYALGLSLHQGTPEVDDVELHEDGVVRIYDILMDYRVLAETDNWLARTMTREEFKGRMGTAKLHWLLGHFVKQEMDKREVGDVSMLAAAYDCGVPVYTSSPGDSTIGLDLAALNLLEKRTEDRVALDPSIDVNQTAAIVYSVKKNDGKTAVVILGGGSPKNFILQTEPQLQEILGFHIKGHDYFIQITDARPDTGGLSGATPSEAVSWSKVEPDALPNSVVCYADTTIVLPILTAYLMARGAKRKHKRLFERIDPMVEDMRAAFMECKDHILGKKGVEEVVRFLRSKVTDNQGED